MADHRGTVRLARIGSVDVFIHWSWLVIVALLTLGFQGWLTTTDEAIDPALAWLLAIVGTLVFLGSVLIHELAHAFMAKARGIEVGGITLFVFGGATEADASSRSARDELVVAIVGPLTSLAVSAVLAALWLGLGGDSATTQLVGYLALVNAVLAGFNLIPGLPLDGGRVLRAIVWAVTGDYAKATRLASSIGVAAGYGLIAIGLVELWAGALGGLWLAAIGWLIANSARETGTQDRLREAFAGQTAADLMTSPVVAIPAGTPVLDAVDRFMARYPVTVFPIVSETGTGLIGTIDIGAVRGLSPEEARGHSVSELAKPVDPELVVTPDEPAIDVVRLLAGSPNGARVLVAVDGRPLGIVSPRDVMRRGVLVDLLHPPPGGADGELIDPVNGA